MNKYRIETFYMTITTRKSVIKLENKGEKAENLTFKI